MHHFHLRTSVIIALALATGPGFATSGQAGQEFADACKLYNKGDIKGANAAFEQYTRKYPGLYQGHYQLANTYMQTGLLHQARKQYELTVNHNPDITTLNRCLAAIGTIDRAVSQRGSLSIPTADSLVETASTADEPKDALQKQADDWQTSRTLRAEKERTAILEDARKRATAVREEAKKRLADLEANHNWICVDGQGRLVGNVVPTRVRDSILEPAETEATRILEEGQRRADSVQTPGSLTAVSEAMHRQAQGSGVTPKIDLAHSSLTVRNYLPSEKGLQQPPVPASGKLVAGKESRHSGL